MPNTFVQHCDSQLPNSNRTSSDKTDGSKTANNNKTASKTILLLGHSGFIGQQVLRLLQATPHILRTPSRQKADFRHPNQAQLARLVEGVDVVINMIGVMSQDERLLEQIHHHAPVAMARLAKQQGVKRWINLSALGADAQHAVAFVSSKGRGDAALLALDDANFNVSIARPSLVFGCGGASCELFLKLAQLSVLALPNAGKQLIQPVHVDDVAQGLVNLAGQSKTVTDSKILPHIIDFTGAEQCTLADYLTMMRTTIHNKRPALIVSIPSLLAKIGSGFIRPFLPEDIKNMMGQDSLTLLEEGAIADNTAFIQLLERQPLGYQQFNQSPPKR